MDIDNTELTALVEQVTDYESELILHETKAANVKRLILNLVEKEIPLKLSEMGLKEATLKDGTTITVTPMYFAKISEANKVQAFNWLRDHGLGDIIKRSISIDFTKGEDEAASGVRSLLEGEGHMVNDQESVHYQTLSAVVREQIEKGTDIPRQLLGVFQKNEAKIKRGGE